jgi:hypothetical protein
MIMHVEYWSNQVLYVKLYPVVPAFFYLQSKHWKGPPRMIQIILNIEQNFEGYTIKLNKGNAKRGISPRLKI